MLSSCTGSTATDGGEQASPTSEGAADDSTNAPDESADEEVESPGSQAAEGESEGEPSDDSPTLEDEDLEAIEIFAAGEQVQDAQGNLLSIYGFVRWPQPYESLPEQSRESFPFFGDVEDLRDANADLLVLDVAMCAAGLNATGSGTADFFVHADANDALSDDTVVNRGLLARHPVVSPRFAFPPPATCSRGWLPVLWTGDDDPSTARYLLANRASAGADVEQFLYQWELDELVIADDVPRDDEVFGVGQQVTFNAGLLSGTTVSVDGWAERIGEPSPVEGTRLVAIELSYCAGGTIVPQFGLGLDGWNLAAPLPLDDATQEEAAAECFDGWIDFAVPFGAVPTSFFASDGRNAVTGYAEWSLDNAALAPPS